MRTHLRIIDIKLALYELRRSKGRYLSDTSYQDLRQEEHDDLEECALLLIRSDMELRRVVRERRRVWRFMNKNGL